MPRWTKAFVEIYTTNGYQGCWEVTPSPDRGGWELADLPDFVRRIRGDMRYAYASLQYSEDGDALVIGVFDGVEPPDTPKRGQVIVPDTFEDDL